WHAVGAGADINDPANNRRPDGSVGFRSDHGGQAGTVFDMLGEKGGESFAGGVGVFGSRLAPAGFGYLAGKEARIGPTLPMLNASYGTVVWAGGDVSTGALGPLLNHSSDDVGMIEQFLTSGTSLDWHSAWLIGNGIARGASGPLLEMLQGYFGVGYRGGYTNLAQNYANCADLVPTSPPFPPADNFGLETHFCASVNNVLTSSGDPNLAASPYSYYQAVGTGAPYIAGVRTDLTGSKHYKTAFDGFDMEDIHSRFCLGSSGRLGYFAYMLE